MTDENTQRGNVTVEGGIDAGWTSYYDAEEHGNMNTKTGETVAGTTEDDKGELKTEWWPEAIEVDPCDLNETQRAVIRYVVFNDVSDRPLVYVSRKATPNKSRTYAHGVLRKYWPEKLKELTGWGSGGEPPQSNVNQPDQPRVIENVEELDVVRRRLLAGDTTSKIAEEYGASRSTIGEYARGDVGKSLEGDCDTPPLEWDRENGKYVLPKDEGGEPSSDEIEKVEVKGPKPCGEHHPLPCGLDKACEFQSDSGELETALDAIEATAQSEETKQAVEYLRGLL